MMALVAGGTLNSSAANFRTAVKGVVSGTLNLNDQRTSVIIYFLIEMDTIVGSYTL